MSLNDALIIKLFIENNYLNIQELARLRAISRFHKAIIDTNWLLIVRKLLNSIPVVDINTVVRLVYKNDELLQQVLAKRQLKTGYILFNNGTTLLTLLQVQPEYISPISRQILINELYVDLKFQKLLEIHRAACLEDLDTFKQLYYDQTDQRTDMIYTNPVTQTMYLIFGHYIREKLLRNTKDYKINWQEIEKWNQTAFYKFIKPAIKIGDLTAIIVAFGVLSKETLNRERKNIVEFIKRTFTPYIEQEKILLQKTLTHTLTELPPMYGHTLTKNIAEKFIITQSLIRRLPSAAALVDSQLAIEYFNMAHELFDLTNDPALIDLPEHIVRSETFDLIPVYTKWYQINFDVYSFLLVLLNKLDMDMLVDDIDDKNTMLVLKTKIGLLQKKEPDVLEKQYGQMYNLEDSNVLLPIYSHMSTVGLELSMLMSTQFCMQLFEKLPNGGRPYDIFLNRDLNFWKHYIDIVILQRDNIIDEYKTAKLLELARYHMTLYSIDVTRYILLLLGGNDLALLANKNVLYDGITIVQTWADKLIDEILEMKGLKKNTQPIHNMVLLNRRIPNVQDYNIIS
jgi:hypothetical protein